MLRSSEIKPLFVDLSLCDKSFSFFMIYLLCICRVELIFEGAIMETGICPYFCPLPYHLGYVIIFICRYLFVFIFNSLPFHLLNLPNNVFYCIVLFIFWQNISNKIYLYIELRSGPVGPPQSVT